MKVALRVRPVFGDEKNITKISDDWKEITFCNPSNKSEVQRFGFDVIFPPQCDQEDLYRQVADPVLQSALSGFNGTIFAYGQTGFNLLFIIT